jgi:hypothetical protein
VTSISPSIDPSKFSSRSPASSSAMKGFSYKPLASPREIRVLDLKFSDDISAPIELKMRHMTIEDPPEMTYTAMMREWETKRGTPSAYKALSYTWGDATKDCHLVKVNDTEVLIGANLESALRNLRAREVTPLWVDAICINQSDDVEKSIQVQLMSKIYESAFLVVIWLGEARATTALAINFLKKHVTLDFWSSTQLSIKNELARTRLNPEYAAAWDAVGQDLLKRPWWMRMWVIQEVVLARRTSLFCGPFDLPWDNLEIASRFALSYDLPIFYKTPEEIEIGDQFLQAWNLMNKSRYREAVFGDRTELRLQELLMNNISCFASDPRDMIFSLLGLATDVNDASELVIDYQKPVQQVYTDLIKFQVRKYESLDIICGSKHPKKLTGLPSWVPDWSNMRERTAGLLPSFEHDPNQYGKYVYRASGNTKPNARFLRDDQVLSVSGVVFDTIVKMGEWANNYQELIALLDPWKDLALGSNLKKEHDEYVVGGESMLDAFNRTITADKTRSGHRAQRGQRGLEVLTGEEHDLPDSYRSDQELSDEERRFFWQEDSIQAIALRASRRRLIVTKKGYLGLGPINAQLGDAVVIILGLSVPAVLRRTDETWHFVGEAFVTGIMDGEVVEQKLSSHVEGSSETAASAFEVEEILLC